MNAISAIPGDELLASAVDMDAVVRCGYGGPGWTDVVDEVPMQCGDEAVFIAQLRCGACGARRRVPLCHRHLLTIRAAADSGQLKHTVPCGGGRVELDDAEGCL